MFLTIIIITQALTLSPLVETSTFYVDDCEKVAVISYNTFYENNATDGSTFILHSCRKEQIKI